MNNAQYCPQCGAELPQDNPQKICPKCIIGLGLSPSFETGSEADTLESSGGFDPPKPHELAPHFPQLEILDLIGQGGMGAVYKARQRGLDRLIALKILPPEASRDPAFSKRFGREARALARLNHPHIVSVYDSGHSGGLYYFLMEFVDGINLRQAIQTGELSPEEALSIVPQVCDALQYAHEEGIVHRDIKPENVLLDQKGSVKIADFGLARLLGQAGDSFQLTGTHQVMGTPRYMAPEQMEGAHEVDHRADIYSLGVVFYEMLTGELPLGRFAPPSRKVRVDVRLDEVVLRTLEKEPGLRYQQVSELKTAVETISGLRQLPPHIQRMYGYEYRSKAEIFGWPLVHIAKGIDPQTGKKRIAKGIIAVGDIAIGLLALGGVAIGGTALGGCAIGLITFGGASLGLLVAIGGGAIGLGLSMGGLAVGSVAVGGLAVGVFAYGGGAFGAFAYGANAQNPNALRLFGGALPARQWLPFLVVPCTLFVCFIVSVIVSIGNRLSRTQRLADRPQDAPVGKRNQSTSRVSVGALVMLLLLVVPCLIPVVLLTGYWSLARRPADPAASIDAAYDGPFEQLAAERQHTRTYHLELTPTGPEITDEFARSLRVSGDVQREINDKLRDVYEQYLGLEADHIEQSVNEAGHQVTVVTSFPSQVEQLEHELWSELDELLDVEQQRIARSNLEIYPDSSSSLNPTGPHRIQGLLGWGPAGATIAIWQVGSWYHWKVQHDDRESVSQGPELLPELRRYWREDESE